MGGQDGIHPEEGEYMTENALKGYLLRAMQRAEIPAEKIAEAMDELRYLLEIMTPEAAAAAYELRRVTEGK